MKLPQLTQDGQPIIWAHKTQRATVMGLAGLTGVLPLALLLIFPYSAVFKLVMLNLVVDIYRTRKKASRWGDIFRKFRWTITAGYWRTQSRHRLRQTMRVWDNFKGQYH